MHTVHKNYIDGAWIESSSDSLYKNMNPSNLSEVTGIF